MGKPLGGAHLVSLIIAVAHSADAITKASIGNTYRCPTCQDTGWDNGAACACGQAEETD